MEILEISSKLTIEVTERRKLGLSSVSIVTCEQISHIALVFLLLTFNKYENVLVIKKPVN